MRYTAHTHTSGQCDWCHGNPSAWKITDNGGWDDYACDWHARNLFPGLFTLAARLIRTVAPRRGVRI